MSAKLEIEIVDHGTPATGTPTPAPPTPAPESSGLPTPGTTPGTTPGIPGIPSIPSTPGAPAAPPAPPPASPPEPPPPAAVDPEPPAVEEPEPVVVEPEEESVELALGGRGDLPFRRADWREAEGPAGWRREVDRFNDGGDGGGGEPAPDKGAGMDRLLYQAGLGRLGNLAAMYDNYQEKSAEGAAGGKMLMAQMGLAQAVSGVVAGGLDAVSGGVKGAAGVAGSLVQGDSLGAIQQVSGAMQGLAEKIPVVGEAVAAGLGLVESAAMGLVDVFQSITGRGKELAQYSPEVAQQVALQEAAAVINDVREAQALGGDYARMIQIETEMQNLWRDSLIPIKKVIVEILAKILEQLDPILKQLPKFLENMGKGFGSAVAGLEQAWPVIESVLGVASVAPQAFRAVQNIAQTLGQVEQNTRPANEANLMQNFFDVLEGGVQANIPVQRDFDDFDGGRALPAQIIEP